MILRRIPMLLLMFAFGFVVTACTEVKQDPAPAMPEKCTPPAPCPPPPKVVPIPKIPEPKCPEGAEAVQGTVKELILLPTGSLSLRIDDEKRMRFVRRNAFLTIEGRQVTADEVSLWFKQLKEPVRVRLILDSNRLEIAAEFWVSK